MVIHKETLFSLVVICTVALDQLSKWMTLTFLKTPVVLLPFLDLRFGTNTGIAFGLLKAYSWIPFIISLLVIGAILYYYKTIESKSLVQVLFAFILGGVIGNFIDRIVHGHVIDFINFSFWPTFNIADSAICIGGIGLLLYYWKK